jgi:hypothetical protein
MEALLTLLLSERIGDSDVTAPSSARGADVKAVRARIRDGMKGTQS